MADNLRGGRQKNQLRTKHLARVDRQLVCQLQQAASVAILANLDVQRPERAAAASVARLAWGIRKEKPRRSGIVLQGKRLTGGTSAVLPEEMQHVLHYATQPSSPLVPMLVVEDVIARPPHQPYVALSHRCLRRRAKPSPARPRPRRANVAGSGTCRKPRISPPGNKFV